MNEETGYLSYCNKAAVRKKKYYFYTFPYILVCSSALTECWKERWYNYSGLKVLKSCILAGCPVNVFSLAMGFLSALKERVFILIKSGKEYTGWKGGTWNKYLFLREY
jgi:hypothetical protein